MGALSTGSIVTKSTLGKAGPMTSHFLMDGDENPAGGTSSGVGYSISWQNGPLQVGDQRVPPNGAFVEDIIAVAKHRLEFFQDSKFACSENATAIKCLEDALKSLESRTKRREAEGTEGTHNV